MEEQNFQMCRICISNAVGSQMISIFGQDVLWKKLKTFADVEIEENDNLPQQVCVACAKNVLNAFLFKRKCEEADHFYRRELLRKIDKTADVITISESGSDHDNDPDEEFDFSSIQLSEQTNGFNPSFHLHNGEGDSGGSSSGPDMDDDHLPLIPEIEMITPQDEADSDDSDAAMPQQSYPNQNAGVPGSDNSRRYQCSICFESFALKQILKYHMKISHNKTSPMYECPVCAKTYLYKRFLDKHMRRGRCVRKRRNQTRPMQCSACRVVFPTGHHLGWHKRTGCPAEDGKQPSPDALKQTNHFAPIPIKKENIMLYNNQKKMLTKRRGRTRVKLTTAMLAHAKDLIAKGATTAQLSEMLSISRTFAWRLRKNILPSVQMQAAASTPQAANEQNAMMNIPFHADMSMMNDNEHETTVEEHEPAGLQPPSFPLQSSVFNNTHIKEENEAEADGSSFENRGGEEEEEDEEEYGSDGQDEAENLSIKHEESGDYSPQPSCSKQDPLGTSSKKCKKPRKPNVFLDEEKYAKAKILLAENKSTLEIARILNVSQMTAWKLRDSINKGIELTFRQKTEPTVKKRERMRAERLPKQRLKAAERAQRDKEITREIIAMMKEDATMQYWKISERLASKGFTMSTSSVCQKLKSMGIQRRSRMAGDQQISDIDAALKLEDEDNSYFDESGAHFLSAFTD